jgi:ribonuclease HII
MARLLIGSDEVGYGAWAGPLVVCAVATSTTRALPAGLTDSKALTKAARERIYAALHAAALPCVLVQVSSEALDRVGVHAALIAAHTQAIQQLRREFRAFCDADVVVDGTVALPDLPEARVLPKADTLVPAVSAASVIAKVARDTQMAFYDRIFPGYGFAENVGYGTKEHTMGLERLGVCDIHRRSYRPIKKYLASPS